MRAFKALFALLIVLLISAAFALPAYANSPAPPWLTVETKDAPEDLELIVTLGDGEGAETLSPRGLIKNTFQFGYPGTDGEPVLLHVRTDGGEYSFEVTDIMRNNGAKLSFDSGEPQLAACVSGVWQRLPGDFLMTVALELIVLLICGYRKGRTILIVIITNVITQLLYHCWLEFVFYPKLNWFPWVIIVELVVIFIEGLIYCFTFREQTKARAWGYAFIANVVSAMLGTVLLAFIRALV